MKVSPTLKKVAAAVAAKQVWDKVQEARNPKPSLGARLGKASLLLGAGGGLFYLFKTGQLRSVVERVTGSKPSSGSSTWSYDEDRVPAQSSVTTSPAGSSSPSASTSSGGAASTTGAGASQTSGSAGGPATGASPSGSSGKSSSTTSGSRTGSSGSTSPKP